MRSFVLTVLSQSQDADGDIGPRMSIALLCAEGDFKVPFLESKLRRPVSNLSGQSSCSLTSGAGPV